MQKDQLRVAHTTRPNRSGRQASSRRPCCHKESAVVSRLSNSAGRESTERHRCQHCVSETSSPASPIEAQLNQPACRRQTEASHSAGALRIKFSTAMGNSSAIALNRRTPCRGRRRYSPARNGLDSGCHVHTMSLAKTGMRGSRLPGCRDRG